jgi:hypothetical protein
MPRQEWLGIQHNPVRNCRRREEGETRHWSRPAIRDDVTVLNLRVQRNGANSRQSGTRYVQDAIRERENETDNGKTAQQSTPEAGIRFGFVRLTPHNITDFADLRQTDSTLDRCAPTTSAHGSLNRGLQAAVGSSKSASLLVTAAHKRRRSRSRSASYTEGSLARVQERG